MSACTWIATIAQAGRAWRGVVTLAERSERSHQPSIVPVSATVSCLKDCDRVLRGKSVLKNMKCVECGAWSALRRWQCKEINVLDRSDLPVTRRLATDARSRYQIKYLPLYECRHEVRSIDLIDINATNKTVVLYS